MVLSLQLALGRAEGRAASPFRVQRIQCCCPIRCSDRGKAKIAISPGIVCVRDIGDRKLPKQEEEHYVTNECGCTDADTQCTTLQLQKRRVTKREPRSTRAASRFLWPRVAWRAKATPGPTRNNSRLIRSQAHSPSRKASNTNGSLVDCCPRRAQN